MGQSAAILGIHLAGPDKALTRVGTLTRSTDRATTFVVSESYLRDPTRPILSLGWVAAGDEEDTRRRLASRTDKIGLNGTLPPWFAGLLPEGALRDLVIHEMGPGDHDEFDLLARLGADLPGAVVALPETDLGSDIGPHHWETIGERPVPVPEGRVKFSLAGVQLKFDAERQDGRLTAPARSDGQRYILKVPNERYPRLPEVEFASMKLASMIGVSTAAFELVPVAQVDGVSPIHVKGGEFALAVERFDRVGQGRRIHMEDAAQILGAVGDRKYTMGTGETLLNIVRRFSADPRGDLLEGIRRLVADILLGNGDDHLKNWSFLFPDTITARLSPAYDIVATRLFLPGDELALPITGMRNPERIGISRFRRIGGFLKLPEKLVDGTVKDAVVRALDLWPTAVKEWPLTRSQQRALIGHLHRTQLAADVNKGRA